MLSYRRLAVPFRLGRRGVIYDNSKSGEVARAEFFEAGSSLSTISGTAEVTFSATGTLSGGAVAGDMSGTTTVGYSTSGTLRGAGELAGSSGATFSLSGAATGLALVSGSAAVSYSGQGILRGAARLFGHSSTFITPSGTLASLLSASGAAAYGFATAGALRGTATLSGASGANYTVGGDLSGLASISGSAVLNFTTAGNLSFLQINSISGTVTLGYGLSGRLRERPEWNAIPNSPLPGLTVANDTLPPWDNESQQPPIWGATNEPDPMPWAVGE